MSAPASSASVSVSLPQTASASGRRFQLEYLVSVALGCAGVAVLAGASNIRIPKTTNVVDPRFFPRVVGGLLCLCALLHASDVMRGKLGLPDEGEDVDLDVPGDWRSLLVVGMAFIAHALLIKPVGWPLAAFTLFCGAALGHGARPLWKVCAVSIAISGVAFILFRVLLGVYLPAGPFESLL